MQTARRVLLVEDDKDDQMFFCEAINRFYPKIECVIADNGVEAIKAVSLHPPFDIIFMDLNMPLMNGFDCIKKLKEGQFKNIPIVVLTTSNMQTDFERCKNLGAAMCCVKPHSLNALFEELKSIISKGINFHIS